MPVGQTQTETQPLAGGFIISEANHTRSRAFGTITSGTTTTAGKVLAIVAGKYVNLDENGSGGAEVSVAISYDAVDASGGDVAGATIIVRDCEVNDLDLDWGTANATEQATAIGELASVGIIVRTAL